MARQQGVRLVRGSNQHVQTLQSDARPSKGHLTAVPSAVVDSSAVSAVEFAEIAHSLSSALRHRGIPDLNVPDFASHGSDDDRTRFVKRSGAGRVSTVSVRRDRDRKDVVRDMIEGVVFANSERFPDPLTQDGLRWMLQIEFEVFEESAERERLCAA